MSFERRKGIDTSGHIYRQETDVTEAFKTFWNSDVGMRNRYWLVCYGKSIGFFRFVCVAHSWCIIKKHYLLPVLRWWWGGRGGAFKTFIKP